MGSGLCGERGVVRRSVHVSAVTYSLSEIYDINNSDMLTGISFVSRLRFSPHRFQPDLQYRPFLLVCL